MKVLLFLFGLRKDLCDAKHDAGVRYFGSRNSILPRNVIPFSSGERVKDSILLTTHNSILGRGRVKQFYPKRKSVFERGKM